MKTTVEIADELLARARKTADRNGTTLRALIEEGLQLALKTRRVGDKEFRLPTVRGEPLSAEMLARGMHAEILDTYTEREERSWPSENAVHDRKR